MISLSGKIIDHSLYTSTEFQGQYPKAFISSVVWVLISMMISGMLSYALDFSFSTENFRPWSKQINKHTGTAMCIAEETSSALWLDIIARKGLWRGYSKIQLKRWERSSHLRSFWVSVKKKGLGRACSFLPPGWISGLSPAPRTDPPINPQSIEPGLCIKSNYWMNGWLSEFIVR